MFIIHFKTKTSVVCYGVVLSENAKKSFLSSANASVSQINTFVFIFRDFRHLSLFPVAL